MARDFGFFFLGIAAGVVAGELFRHLRAKRSPMNADRLSDSIASQLQRLEGEYAGA